MKNILVTVLISTWLSVANGTNITIHQNKVQENSRKILSTPSEKDNRNNLAQGIPEAAKKFGITDEMVQLLGKYSLVALFTPAWKNKYGSTKDRITIIDIRWDYISFETDTGEFKKTSSIDLSSDKNGNPIDSNIEIGESRKNGDMFLYVERGDFKQWIPQKK